MNKFYVTDLERSIIRLNTIIEKDLDKIDRAVKGAYNDAFDEELDPLVAGNVFQIQKELEQLAFSLRCLKEKQQTILKLIKATQS